MAAPARLRAAWPGSHQPLGATWSEESTNFAVFAPEATAVELCLFDEVDGADVETRCTADRADARHLARRACPGSRRASATASAPTAPGSPARGRVFNPAKLLLDPYARAVSGSVVARRPDLRLPRPASRDLDACAPRSAGPARRRLRAVRPRVGGRARRLRLGRRRAGPAAAPVDRHGHLRAARQGVHARCTTEVPEELRGTYAGLTTNAAVHYLKDLGVTTVELLPVHQFVSEPDLGRVGADELLGLQLDRLLRPARRLQLQPATAASRSREFKAMVKALHAAGLEVILDVVYNHTAEGSPLGPTLCFRGLDDVGYYKHVDWVTTARRTSTSPGAATPWTRRTRRRCG